MRSGNSIFLAAWVFLVLSLDPTVCWSDERSRAVEVKKALEMIRLQRQQYINTLRPLDEAISQAEIGDVLAQAELGRRYMNGYKAPKDLQRAYKWYLKAAQQGHARAQYRIGDIYEYYVEDLTIEERHTQAMKWYTKAAEGCESSAQSQLGYLYQTGGILVKKGLNYKSDLDLALKWYKQAAINNNLSAMAELGLLLAQGEGQQRNETDGLAWYYVATELGGGDARATEFMAIEKGMSPKQLSAAKDRVNVLLREVQENYCVLRTQY